MPAVHHYTDLKGAIGILQSGRIWFTERAHLNDPNEISHGVQIALAILAEKGRTADASRLNDGANRVFDEFRFFSGSFSFADDDPIQWRNYADGGKGVVLSFKASVFNDPKAFIDGLITDDPTAVCCPMSYDPVRLKCIITSIIDCWDEVNIHELINYILMASGLFKEKRWENEREYRFFVHHPYHKILKSAYFRTRKRDDRNVEYLDVPIQGWDSPDGLPIYRICVGNAAPDCTERQLTDVLRARNICPQFGICRA